MGYHMTQMGSDFFISKKNFEPALNAIKALAGNETWKGNENYNAHYAWVNSEFHKCHDLFEIMDDWRWEVSKDDKGNIDNICFAGEKLGDDFILFAAIAPYVKKGSWIEMQGENGDLWRWVFDGEKCKEINARIVWDE